MASGFGLIDEFARLDGQHVVGATDGRVVRRRLDHVGVGLRLFGNLPEGGDEGVERFLALRLGRLDHERLVEEQREVDGRGMETEVEQALGHVEGGDVCRVAVLAAIFGTQAVEDKLVLAQAVDRQFVVVFEALLNIVGAQNGQTAHLSDVLAAQREEVGVGADDDAEVAQPRRDAAQRFGTFGHGERAVVAAHDARVGQELLQTAAHAHGTAAGAAAAMRRGERLVEVDMHHVEAHVARAAYAEDGVEVGAVVVHQAAAFVHHAGNLGDVCLKDAQRVGVGHHHARDVRAEDAAQAVQIDRALGRALHLHNLQAGDSGRGRVGAVGRVGDDDFGALYVAARAVVGADDHQARQLAVGAGVGVDGKLGQPRQFGEDASRLIVEAQGALQVGIAGGGVGLRESRQRRHLLVDFGVVFHRATAQRVEARIDAEVVVRHVGVVACHRLFVRLGQRRRCGALQLGGNRRVVRGPGVCRKAVTPTALFREFEYQFAVISVVHGRMSVGRSGKHY